jgi:hypothetical protein
MTVVGVTKFQHFFRATASLHVDKDDLKRYSDFVNRKLYDLLIRAEATARANLRDVVQPEDLPITKGLQQCVQEFKKLDAEIEMSALVEQLEALPSLDLALSEEAQCQLPDVVGGLTVALARTIRLLDLRLKAPHAAQWEQAFQITDVFV